MSDKARETARRIVNEIVESTPRLKAVREREKHRADYLLRKRSEIDRELERVAPTKEKGDELP